jgi:hypothetical protein
VNSEDVGWAVLFLVVVGLIIAVGVVVGMIVAGRIDRLMVPRPPTPADASPAGEPASADQRTAPDEEEQP